jgi:hypothetical protein
MFRLFLWYLFKKTRCRERIERANAWAEQNKGRTATLTVGTLFLLLVIGSVMTLSGNDEPEMNIIEGIAEVNPMFQGLQQIQGTKAYQLSQVEKLTVKGQSLKRELDSLIRMPVKSHEDSLQIIIKHRQLELIVNNLENR